VGAIIAVREDGSTAGIIIGISALVLATINVVGGYLVTDRMLAMFKPKGKNQ
jgi:NAD(P) transhydrogenase subunit alpha